LQEDDKVLGVAQFSMRGNPLQELFQSTLSRLDEILSEPADGQLVR
jgi:hypothetical protein